MEPLRLAYDLRCGQEHAFAVWTQRIDTWWPRDHLVSGDAGAAVVLEPRVGGRILERTPAGDEIDWGEVTVWDPPRRLGYRWHIRRPPQDATDVLLDFVAVSDDTTRLEITHGGWERLGADGAQWRERNLGGWSRLIPYYERVVVA